MGLDIKNLNIEFLLDKSGSMAEKDCVGGKSRWDFAKETTKALAVHCQQFDPDGITVVPFAGSFKVYENVTPVKVDQVFAENSPIGSTNTASALRSRLDAFFQRRRDGERRSLLIIVMTDGSPDDQDAVADVIVGSTKKIDSDDDLAIQFIQVGKDAAATTFLKFLDDELVAKRGAKFDVVDTVPIDEVEKYTIEELIRKSFED